MLKNVEGRFRFEQPTPLALSFTAYALLNSDWWFRAYALLTFVPADQTVLPITSLNAILAGHLLFKAFFRRGRWLPVFVALGGVSLTLLISEYRLWNRAPEPRNQFFYVMLFTDVFIVGVMNTFLWNNKYLSALVYYDIGYKILTKLIQVPLFGDHNPRDYVASGVRSDEAVPYLNGLQVGLVGWVLLKIVGIL